MNSRIVCQKCESVLYFKLGHYRLWVRFPPRLPYSCINTFREANVHIGTNRFLDGDIAAEFTSLEKGTLKAHGGKLLTMMGFFVSPHMRRKTLALGLCLLAVLFALEAKTAWFAPINGPSGDIQSQKARPADLPAVVSHGVSALSPVVFSFGLIFLVSVASIAWTDATFRPGVDIDATLTPVSAASYFSPALFFRPPPAL